MMSGHIDHSKTSALHLSPPQQQCSTRQALPSERCFRGLDKVPVAPVDTWKLLKTSSVAYCNVVRAASRSCSEAMIRVGHQHAILLC
jgi:hypothetical protein